MPRFFVRHERLPRFERSFKVYAPWWIDPNWYLVGSVPEKMMMAELQRRGIFFIFRAQQNDLGGLVDPTWEADFLLPQHKIWIEVQGSYFHSLKGQIEKDAFRFAVIEMAGWKPIFLWEFDILNRLPDLLNEIGVFYEVDPEKQERAFSRFGSGGAYGATPIDGEMFATGGELRDQLAGLRQALSNRSKPVQLRFVRSRRRRPK